MWIVLSVFGKNGYVRLFHIYSHGAKFYGAKLEIHCLCPLGGRAVPLPIKNKTFQCAKGAIPPQQHCSALRIEQGDFIQTALALCSELVALNAHLSLSGPQAAHW